MRLNVFYFLFWLLYFFVARFIFLLYNFTPSSALEPLELLNTFFFGCRLDLSFAAYICAIPFLTFSFALWISKTGYFYFLKIYSLLTVVCLSFLLVVDLGLYEAWGIRLDASLLTYINTPKEMLASVSNPELATAVCFFIAFSVFSVRLLFSLIGRFKKRTYSLYWWQVPVQLFFTAFLVLIMRGGLQTTPLNQSNVYFSNTMFANHAALNYAWNFTHSLADESYNKKNPFIHTNQCRADKLFRSFRDKNRFNNSHLSVLNNKTPNILIIMWESLTSKVVEPLGGLAGVTENFNILCEEGLLFTNFYANGSRSDKGLVSILSGYYPQPHKSILKNPSKSRSLPVISKSLKLAGYHNSFFYGGDLNFGNMNTYLRGANFDEIIDGQNFSSKNWNSKWGVHDHIVFEKLLSKISDYPAPFFATLFTLSSHEPFEFPGKNKFGADTKTDKFLSSLAYTDSALGQFIAMAKTKDWWDNSLVVILADHGHPLPMESGFLNQPSRFHIPMLWLGGALSKTGYNNSFSTQTDFAYTLLELLNLPSSDYEWGKDLFSVSSDNFSHYSFNMGFGILNEHNVSIFDYTAGEFLPTDGFSSPIFDSLGKSITQITYEDYLGR